jgi:hypothetical protein
MISPQTVYIIECRRRDPRCKRWNFDSIHYNITQQTANNIAWDRHFSDPRYDFRVATYERTSPRS